MNCRNRSLALCLAHTLKKCGELESLDKRITFVTEVIRIQFGDATRICNCKVNRQSETTKNIKDLHQAMANTWRYISSCC